MNINIIISIFVCLSYFALYKVIKWKVNKKDWYILTMFGCVEPILSDTTYNSEKEASEEVERLSELPENSQNSYTYFSVTRTGKVEF